eukprot:GSChrysophyteH2.ASY1.ANO1.1331.1 assembled CDS
MSLYTPYKAVGIVTDGKPFAVNRLGTETFLTVSIGSVFQVYRADKLTVCLVGRETPGGEEITALAVADKETFCAVGKKILVYNRTQIVRSYDEHASTILGLCMVGRTLLSWDEGGELRVIDTQKRVVVSVMQSLQNSAISAVAHPATYINKFVVGYSGGALELWNVRKCKLVHSFTCHNDNAKTEALMPGVTCLHQSPATDVFGVGFSDGTILMINLKLDRVLFSFKQEGGAVTSVTFRTDSSAQVFPFMASASGDGRIHIWNLEAHRGAISSIEFLHGEPIMISAAEDNTIKMWIFDAPDGSARLLRSREGHIGHSNKIRYYGESCEMVSAGSDGTLRLFNTAIESQNREMSQKPILKKLGLSRRNERLPVVADFDFSETRQKDWGNLVTIHHHHANAYLWRYKHRVVTEMVLRQPQWHGDERIGSTNRMHHSTAVTVTPCGNFALVGSRGGVIYRYNLQSGLPRGSFPKDEAKSAIKKGTIDTLTQQQKELPSRHEGEIRGLFVDTSNSVLVSVGLDGNTLFWDMYSAKVMNCIRSDTAHLMLVGLRDAGFAAVASQDRVVRVYDMATCKLARRFSGHSREISDMAFTPDGRRLLTSSADSTVRVWDMPTGRCLTWLSFSAPILSLAVALSGESLAMSQAGKDGIYVYVDRSLYEPSGIGTDAGDKTDEELATQAQVETGAARETIEQRAPGAITMSALPRGYWSSLFHLEVIKARNKPVAPVAAPKSAPFFLPTVFRGGSTSSFPTPQEFAKLEKNLKHQAQAQAVQSEQEVSGVGGVGKRPSSSTETSSNGSSNKKQKMGQVAHAEESHAADFRPMDISTSTKRGAVGAGDMVSDESAFPKEEHKGSRIGSASSTSRLISRRTVLPRCKLVAYLLQEFPDSALGTYASAEFFSGAGVGTDSDSSRPSGTLEYLKTLAPPAVDLELRALCTHGEDEEGLKLLHCLLSWLAHCMRSGRDFEVLEAYLHRTLLVYGEIIVTKPSLLILAQHISAAHADNSQRLRGLVQGNLCLLKLLAGLPPL